MSRSAQNDRKHCPTDQQITAYARLHEDDDQPPDALVDAVKAKAAAEGRTFTSMVEEGLRAALAVPTPRAEAVMLPAFGEPGGRLLVDPADREAIWEILDADGPR